MIESLPEMQRLSPGRTNAVSLFEIRLKNKDQGVLYSILKLKSKEPKPKLVLDINIRISKCSL